MNIQEHAVSPSSADRRQVFEYAVGLEGKERFDAVVALLATPYKDLGEAVLESCTPDVIRAWKPWLSELTANYDPEENPRQTQGILVLMQRFEGDFAPEWGDFCHKCLESQNPDVRYQAFCLAELREESSEEYLGKVRSFLHSPDEDMRIVAIQALTRLKPDWACSEIEDISRTAGSLESFHALLALVRLSDENKRTAHVLKMSQYLDDGRYCFVAAQCIFDYGVKDNIPALLSVAKSILAEPTNRVAAAAAAAKLGSDEGKELLQKFSQSRHGNPNYARELLEKLNQPN